MALFPHCSFREAALAFNAAGAANFHSVNQ